MITKLCKNCGRSKPLDQMTKKSGCKKCMSAYLRAYKAPRLSYSETLLTDDEMKKEMRTIKKFDTKRLNALIDFSDQFDRVCKIKSFHNPEIVKPVLGNPKAKIIHLAFYS